VHHDAAVLAMVRKIFGDWNNHDATRMGAALAFYSAPNLPARSANQDTLKRQPSAGRTLALPSEASALKRYRAAINADATFDARRGQAESSLRQAR